MCPIRIQQEAETKGGKEILFFQPCLPTQLQSQGNESRSYLYNSQPKDISFYPDSLSSIKYMKYIFQLERMWLMCRFTVSLDINKLLL